MFGLEMSAEESYELAQTRGAMMKKMVNTVDFEKYSPKVRQKIIDRYNSVYTRAIKQHLLVKRMNKGGIEK
jgi:hypothetical protein